MDQNQAASDILFPPIDPHHRDWLAVGGGHRLYFEESGNPAGFPVLFLHGGPGSRSRPVHRRFFDPQFYRVVLFDQRGCGLSLPPGSVLQNTTSHLIADIEGLRQHLGISRWLLFGGSWGSTLGLAYAIAHTDRVAGMVLRGVFLGSQAEVQWYLSGLRRFAPEAHAELSANTDGSPLSHYLQQVNHPEREIALAAARRWCEYEARVMSLGDPTPSGESAPPDELLSRSRVQLHYLAHDCFLRPGELLDNLWRIGDKPTIIVQGGLDMICPPQTAVEVARRLRRVELRLVANGGHSALQPGIAVELCAATSRMQTLLAGQAP